MTTRVEIAATVRNKTDQSSSLFIGEAELYGYINEGIRELHRLLADAFTERFLAVSSPTTIAGSAITLPADFWRLRALFRTAGNGVGSRPLQLNPFSLQDLHRGLTGYRLLASTIEITPAEDAPGTYLLYYITTPTQLTTDGAALAGAYEEYLEYIEAAACIPVVMKAEQDVGPYMKIKAAKIDEITDAAANRSTGPAFIPPAQLSDHTYSRLYPFNLQEP